MIQNGEYNVPTERKEERTRTKKRKDKTEVGPAKDVTIN